MRKTEGHLNDNKSLCRNKRWHAGIENDVLQLIGRGPPPQTNVSRAAARVGAPPDSHYEPEDDEFSLGEAWFSPLLNDQWHFVSPKTANAQTLFWRACVVLKGEVTRIEKLWHSLLATVGTIIQDKEGRRGVVAKVTPYGVICFALDAETIAGQNYIYLETG